MKKLSQKELRESLSHLSKEELVEFIVAMSENPAINDYIASQIIGEEVIYQIMLDLEQKIKKKILSEDFRDAKNLISGFRKTYNSNQMTTELTLFYVLVCLGFVYAEKYINRKDENTLIATYKDFVKLINNEPDSSLYERLKPDIDHIDSVLAPCVGTIYEDFKSLNNQIIWKNTERS